MSEKRIIRWLKGAVYRKHATTINLARLQSRAVSLALQTFYVETDGEEGFSERELGEEIFQVACEEALTVGGRRNRYQLLADTEDESNVSQMAFAIVNKAEDALDGFEGGRDHLIPQMMRHTELLMRTTVGSFQMQMRMMQQSLELVSDRLIASEDRASQAWTLVHETQDARMLLTAETKVLETQAENSAEIQKQFISWIPAIASHVMRKAGSDITVGIPKPFLDFLQSIEPEQMLALTEVLKPEQSAVVGELYMAVVHGEGEAE